MKADAQLRALIADVQAVRRVSRRAVRVRRLADACVVTVLARHLPPAAACAVGGEVVRAYRAAGRAAYQDGWRDAKRESRAEVRALLQELAPMGASPRRLTERWHSEIVRVVAAHGAGSAVTIAEEVIALMETAVGLAKVAGRREGIVVGRRAADRRRKCVS